VNHLKSHYVPFDVSDPEAEAKRANELRQRQCEVAAAIIASEMRPNSRYLVVGDMNDPPDSEFMALLTASPELDLVSGLADAKETRPSPGNPPPPTTAWTERFKPTGKPAEYTLIDLPAFGTADRTGWTPFPDIGGEDDIRREWKVILVGATPGQHTLKYRTRSPQTVDGVWTFVVAKK
jgi:hypothetical protein